MDGLIPPHIKAGLKKETASKSEPASQHHESSKLHPRVAVAPVVHGRSFNLRWSYNENETTGQMLVLLDKKHFRAPLEVIQTFFPTAKTRAWDKKRERFYLGDRKLGKEYAAGILEIKIIPGEEIKYRLLYPSNEPMHDWKVLDLNHLRLKTNEDQRSIISAFTGVIYKAQETRVHKSHKHAPSQINRAVDEHLARTLKKHIKSK